jgi:predicted transcriptional regulator
MQPITLPPDVEARLSQLAADLGRDVADLAGAALAEFVAEADKVMVGETDEIRARWREQIEQAIAGRREHEAWFLAEVQKGIDEADAGHVIDNADMRAWIDRRFPR